MVVDYQFRAIHVAVTNRDGVAIKDFSKIVAFRCLSTRAMNRCPMLLLTFLLNGRLYQSMLFCGLFLHLVFVMGLQCRVYWCPSLSDFWYGGEAWSKNAFDERVESRFLMLVGMFLVMVCG